MARRTVNRKEKRAEHEAYERRKEDEEEGEEEEEEEDEDEEGDEDEESEGEGEAEAGDEDEDEAGDEDEEEEAPKKKAKAKPKPPPKPKAKPRSRVVKVVRMRVIWGVFNNSHQMVASYPYPKRHDADAHATRLMTDKKQTHFVQPVKEPIPEEKVAEVKEPKSKK